MQLYNKPAADPTKIGIGVLAKKLSEGLQNCSSLDEKKKFGIETMGQFDVQQDMEKYKYHDPKQKGKYFRNLVYMDDNIALISIVWTPGALSPIHAHNCEGWWVVGLEGQLEEKGKHS